MRGVQCSESTMLSGAYFKIRDKGKTASGKDMTYEGSFNALSAEDSYGLLLLCKEDLRLLTSIFCQALKVHGIMPLQSTKLSVQFELGKHSV
jgi:hypothetical protein